MSKVSRRKFLGASVAGGVLAALGAQLPNRLPSQATQQASTAAYALLIDAAKCTGCGACVQACHLRNELPDEQSYIHRVDHGEGDERWYLMVQCQHCANAPCAAVCPTNATYTRQDGVVLINAKLCVGCKYCVVACPYQARIFNEKRGVADKCWLCLDWVLAGAEPACVQACIPGARMFGRTDDPGSELNQLIASGRARPLHPEFGTRPAVLRYIIE